MVFGVFYFSFFLPFAAQIAHDGRQYATTQAHSRGMCIGFRGGLRGAKVENALNECYVIDIFIVFFLFEDIKSP